MVLADTAILVFYGEIFLSVTVTASTNIQKKTKIKKYTIWKKGTI